MNVSSFAELERAIKQAVKSGMKEVGEKSKEVVKQKIDSEVYAKYSPVEYSRTYELRESVDSKDVGDLEIEIYHDASKISPHSPNQHMSVIDGSSSADAIPEIVHDGLSGSALGDGAWRSARPYMDKAAEEIESKDIAKKAIEQELKKKGFKV